MSKEKVNRHHRKLLAALDLLFEEIPPKAVRLVIGAPHPRVHPWYVKKPGLMRAQHWVCREDVSFYEKPPFKRWVEIAIPLTQKGTLRKNPAPPQKMGFDWIPENGETEFFIGATELIEWYDEQMIAFS